MVLDNALVILTQVLTLFILIGTGYAITKFGLVTQSGAKQMTSVLLTLVTPAVIINAFAIPFDRSKLAGIGIAFAVAVASNALGLLIGLLLFRKEPQDSRRVYKFAIMYSNVGYMAIPLINAALGPDAVMYGVMAIIAFNVFAWSHGIILMADKSEVSVKRILLSPGILGTCAALLIFFFSLNIPTPVLSAVKMLANINTPLAMIIVGAFIANVDFKSILTQKGIYLATAVRLIIIPLTIISVLRCFALPELIYKTCVISASAPVAANTSLFAVRYSRDAKLAGKLVAFSTLCSILTMPLMLLIG